MINSEDAYSLPHSKRLVEAAIADFLTKRQARAAQIDNDYEVLLNIMQKHVAAGGKRLRPYLVMLAYAAYGGDSTKVVVPVAAAWELLHVAMLVHDDIIDRDDIRHGAPNIARQYRDIYANLTTRDHEHYSAMSALLAGDLYISMAQQIILESDLSAEEKVAMLTLLNEAIFTVAGGELMDTETVLKPLEATNARKIAQYKTADYSVESPLKSGAVLAGAPESEIQKLIELGRRLGIAFQIIDDVLGVFGDDKETGKTTDGDIRERKHTILIQEAYQRLQGEDHEMLLRLYDMSHDMTDADVATVRRLLTESGVRAAVEAEAMRLTEEVRTIVESLDIEQPARDAFLALIDMLAKRKA